MTTNTTKEDTPLKPQQPPSFSKLTVLPIFIAVPIILIILIIFLIVRYRKKNQPHREKRLPAILAQTQPKKNTAKQKVFEKLGTVDEEDSLSDNNQR